ncbi:MAG: hypothetical protein CMM32_05435 [Rhodospirillaceae bacterium]|nr:hypothetical protein [Rhodospirillaceae bacterium]|tara:strand:- start:3269 stop:4492 length:1224 start_codon:yes stop_codon:yes gene_type:complete
MQRKKLVIALPTSTFLPAIGGVEIGLHNIASGLLAQGHTPIVIAPATNVRQIQETGRRLAYKLITMPPKTISFTQNFPETATLLLASFFRILQWKYRFDIWHGTVGFPIGVALARFAEKDVPHIIRCAGEDIQVNHDLGYGMRLDPRIDQIIRKWLPRADALSAITKSMAREYDDIKIISEKVWNIPNGVDLPRFQRPFDTVSIRKEFGINNDAFLYLSVGRHHPKKGFSDLISAAALLRKKASRPFRLAIAGKHTETLKNQVAKQGLTEHVHLLGEISDQDAEGSPFEAPSNKLVGLYKSADAFVFPSHVESFGIAIIEAMAASLPIITTDGPGCRDVIGQGKYGIMVPVKDHEGLAEAMNQLLSHKDLREKYINISRERALVFAWRSIVNQYLEAYRTIIRRKAL